MIYLKIKTLQDLIEESNTKIGKFVLKFYKKFDSPSILIFM